MYQNLNVLQVPNRKIFFLFLNKTYVVGTQKDRLIENPAELTMTGPVGVDVCILTNTKPDLKIQKHNH